MGAYKGFVRLNAEQKRILEAIKPFNADERLFDHIKRGEIAGTRFERVLPVLRELEEIGYLHIIWNGNAPADIALSSICFCYGREYCINVILPAIANALAGISGGLVVWLLTNLIG